VSALDDLKTSHHFGVSSSVSSRFNADKTSETCCGKGGSCGGWGGGEIGLPLEAPSNKCGPKGDRPDGTGCVRSGALSAEDGLPTGPKFRGDPGLPAGPNWRFEEGELRALEVRAMGGASSALEGRAFGGASRVC